MNLRPSSFAWRVAWSVAALSFSSCTTYRYETRIPNERFEVVRHDRGNGVTETFIVEARLEAKIEAVVETDRQRPFLGLQLQ